jgi:hypothetical protein
MTHLRKLPFLLIVQILTLTWALNSSATINSWFDWTEQAERSVRENTQSLFPWIQSTIPSLHEALQADLKSKDSWMPLWTTSYNFDEGAHAEIVMPEILDSLLERFSAPPRNDRIVHAGIEHTYGYLFSNLKTPFGYKRERWISGQIENGLQLPAVLLDLETPRWGFTSQVSFLMGSLALQERTDVRGWIAHSPSWVSPELWSWRTSAEINWKRLVETAHLTDGVLEIRTDFIPLEEGGYWLIYSIFDSRADNAPRLVSAFPVNESAMRRSLDEKHLGTAKKINVRYNAAVPNLDESRLKGSRSVIMMRTE